MSKPIDFDRHTTLDQYIQDLIEMRNKLENHGHSNVPMAKIDYEFYEIEDVDAQIAVLDQNEQGDFVKNLPSDADLSGEMKGRLVILVN